MSHGERAAKQLRVARKLFISLMQQCLHAGMDAQDLALTLQVSEDTAKALIAEWKVAERNAI